MRAFVWSQFRFRRNRVLVLGLAILVAAVSFVLLTSTAKSSSLHIHGTIKTNFRPAYDILVRPRGSKTPLERQQGLVPPNYLSGIFGGITLKQWHQILRLRGVEVAAPIANLGFVLPFGYPQMQLSRYVRDQRQIFRAHGHWLTHNGHSRYPDLLTNYVYITRNRATFDRFEGFIESIGRARSFRPCSGVMAALRQRGTASSPFARFVSMKCFSTSSPDADGPVYLGDWEEAETVGTVFNSTFSFLLSAIDPHQEARLVHLPRTIVAGRYLGENEGIHWDRKCAVCNTVIPVLVATRTYMDEPFVVDVERIRLPSKNRIAQQALTRASVLRYISRQPAEHVARKTFSSAALYAQNLGDWLPTAGYGRGAPIQGYWDVGGVTYRVAGDDHLVAQTVRNPDSVWRSNNYYSGFYPAPPGSQDTSFRRLTAHPDSQSLCGPLTASGVAVGRFDPAKLPGFSPLSRVPLETYSPPTVIPADARSRRVLGGRPLGPTMNLADYVSQPPLLLTNLRSALRFLGRWRPSPLCGARVFTQKPPFIFQKTSHAAPISVIRVRVKGVTGPDPLSLQRIKVVAQKIHDATGLDVDITAGSSPHPLVVDLPAGKFERSIGRTCCCLC